MQAQLNKAFEGNNSYVDYILYGSKSDSDTQLECMSHGSITGHLTTVLCDDNPSATFTFESKQDIATRRTSNIRKYLAVVTSIVGAVSAYYFNVWNT